MKAHLSYLSYVLRHKWFVFVAGLKIGVPIWRLVKHDWTKFLPCEWFPYVQSFYGYKPTEDDRRRSKAICHCDIWPSDEEVRDRFNAAWNHHQKANDHHWQYWLLTNDSDDPKHKPLPMPWPALLEMVADWAGAGRAITGKWEVVGWYEKNKEKILLYDETRARVETLMDNTCYRNLK